MTLKKIALASFAAAALATAGCSNYDTDHRGNSVQMEPSHNILGIVKTSPGSYAATDNSDMLPVIHTDDLWARRDFSGDGVSFLWGAITIKDY